MYNRTVCYWVKDSNSKVEVLHLALRDARLRHRGGHGVRHGYDPQVRGGGRLRAGSQPAIVDGQLHSGIAQGIGQALYEEAVYDEDGNLVTGTMVDYLIPGPLRYRT